MFGVILFVAAVACPIVPVAVNYIQKQIMSEIAMQALGLKRDNFYYHICRIIQMVDSGQIIPQIGSRVTVIPSNSV